MYSEQDSDGNLIKLTNFEVDFYQWTGDAVIFEVDYSFNNVQNGNESLLIYKVKD
jgi:hypothetical protein